MKSIIRVLSFCLLISVFLCLPVFDVKAEERVTYVADVYALTAEEKDGMGVKLGTIEIYKGPLGLVFDPDFIGIPHGYHGIHLYELPKLGPGKAKNGKLVPGLQAGKRVYSLPTIFVAVDGVASEPVVAPFLNNFVQIDDMALIIEYHGDTYSATPKPKEASGRRAAGAIIDVQ